MAQTYRFFGGSLGEIDAYIDADVVGATTNGDIELKDSSGRTWKIEPSRLDKLNGSDVVHDYASIDTTKPVWSAIDSVQTEKTNSTANDKSHFVNAIKALIKGAK